MKELIITGGLGFIGKNLYKKIRNNWDKIIILDKNTYASDLNFVNKYLRANDEVVIEDICNEKIVNSIIKDGVNIIHLAAESHVDNSFKSSLIFSKTNNYGTHVILEACRFRAINKLMIISTDEVYGESTKEKFENSALNPTNPYSATKASMDLLSQTYFKAFNLPLNIIRSNNIFGPYQNSEKIIPAIARAINTKTKVNIHGKGLTERNFLHVNDFINAIEFVLSANPTGQIFNIKSNNRFKIIDLVEMASDFTNTPIENLIKFVEDRPFNDQVYTVNDDKIRKLGWEEKEDFQTNFKDIVLNKLYL